MMKLMNIHFSQICKLQHLVRKEAVILNYIKRRIQYKHQIQHQNPRKFENHHIILSNHLLLRLVDRYLKIILKHQLIMINLISPKLDHLLNNQRLIGNLLKQHMMMIILLWNRNNPLYFNNEF